MPAGALLLRRRRAHGLTQAQLALRAGTSQAAVSRIERGAVSPSVETLAGLLSVLGEELELGARRQPSDHDAAHLAGALLRGPAERLELAMSWNRLAGEVARAGAEARNRA